MYTNPWLAAGFYDPNAVASLNPAEPVVLRARAKDGSDMRINSFKISDEELQLDFSGTAWVQRYGKDVTSSLLDFSRYPLFDAVLGSVITLFLGWFALSFKNVFR